MLLGIRTSAQDLLPAYDTVVTEDVKTVDITTAPAENFILLPDTLSFNYRSVVFDSVDAIKNDKGFYYKTYLDSLLRASQKQVQRPQQQKPRKPKTDNFFKTLFEVLIWIFAIVFFGYLVYKLFLSNSSLFTRNRKNLASPIAVEKEEDLKDIDKWLRQAIQNGNYRLAVRYLYLNTLQQLADRKLIEINTHKTNYEYVIEMKRHRSANEFASLTLQYEYVWYGEYPVNLKLFEQIQNGFQYFNKTISGR